VTAYPHGFVVVVVEDAQLEVNESAEFVDVVVVAGLHPGFNRREHCGAVAAPCRH
jgi:hypothetical protein